MARLLVKACSTSIQASSPSAQVEAAEGQLMTATGARKKKLIYILYILTEK
jgi:hypothetical protein